MKRKIKSIDTIRARYGYIFVAPWIIGLVLFFFFPIVQSAVFSFSDLSITEAGITTTFAGLKHYKDMLYSDPNYINNLITAVTEMFTTVPFILVVSLIVALMLNNPFPGRIFFRGLYFLPVIIASGLALQLFLTASGGETGEVAVADSVAFGMLDFTEVLKGLNLPSSFESYLNEALSNLFMLIWQSGIQIILIIAGLQSFPDLLYEVAKVEGATKWEEFWFITLPMLLRTLLLVIVFTIVEVVTSANNVLVQQGYNQYNNLKYGSGSAMMWFYFVIVGAIIGLFLLIYNKFLKKWG